MLKKYELHSIVSFELPKKEDLGEVAYEKLGESKMCIVGTPEIIAGLRDKTVSERIDVFKFRHPFEVDVLTKYVRPAVDCELELRIDSDDVSLLRFFANSGKGIAVIPEVGVMEDLHAGAVEAIELPRCPEVIIYGITMMHAHRVLGSSEGVPELWTHET